ncbi:hypothetical protein H311_04883, partial [Anncaliia algerae PRA109]
EFNTKEGMKKEYTNMTSEEHHSSARSDKCLKKDMKEVLELELKLPGTNIIVKKQLEYINEKQTNDMNDWLDTFEEVKDLAKWTENESICVLKELFKNYKINFKEKTYVEIRENLINIFYPKDLANIYLNQLDSVRQEDFIYFNDFLEAIKKRLNAYGMSAGLSMHEQKRKYEESLNRGIAPYTALELAKNSSQTLDE